MSNLKNATWQGFRRADGRFGSRNHVIVLPVDDLSNAAAEAVAGHIKGAMALAHPYGRLQFGADLELHFRTLIGVGCNPNVAAVVVIGIEPGWTGRVVEGIRKSGKPAGVVPYGNKTIAQLFDDGFSMVAAQTELTLLASAARADVAANRSKK